MRITLLLLFACPFIVNAQVNRSANELTQEKIKEYITSRLFKDMPYKTISYGELKPYQQSWSPETTWTMEHIFEITETKMETGKKVKVQRPYRFYFYLDKRIKVRGSENIQAIE